MAKSNNKSTQKTQTVVPSEGGPPSDPGMKDSSDPDNKSPGDRVSVDDMPLSQFASLMASPTVTLFVGPKRKAFIVHKDLLCHVVPYFAKAFNNVFRESRDKEMYLAEENPASIELFMTWLYRGSAGLALTETNIVADTVNFTNLYITADKWCLPVLQNSLVDALLTYFRGLGDDLKTVNFVKIASELYEIPDCPGPIRSVLLSISFELDVTKIEHVYSLIKSNEHFARDLACWHLYRSSLTVYGGEEMTKGELRKRFYV
ncbi:hypothetical protein MMC13_006123 [Lambiella insularis]|nr:hypothetical protein [Lambiella insularis]